MASGYRVGPSKARVFPGLHTHHLILHHRQSNGPCGLIWQRRKVISNTASRNLISARCAAIERVRCGVGQVVGDFFEKLKQSAAEGAVKSMSGTVKAKETWRLKLLMMESESQQIRKLISFHHRSLRSRRRAEIRFAVRRPSAVRD